MNDQDSRQVLARRLRALREEHWPGMKVNQAQLAAALGGDGKRPVSVPLISSWESRTNPKVPPASRIEDIATFFASPRSFDGQVGHLLSPDEMTVQERAARESSCRNSPALRSEALDVPGASWPRATIPGPAQEIAQSLNSGPYRYPSLTIASPSSAPSCHRTCCNGCPTRTPRTPTSSSCTGTRTSMRCWRCSATCGPPTPPAGSSSGPRISFRPMTTRGIWSRWAAWTGTRRRVRSSTRLQLPVRQVSDWDKEGGAYFEVTEEDGRKVAHRPRLDESAGRQILREDVALFARAVSPFNRKRFVTICNGMYGRGTYGAVRALTDERFRDRNAEYIRERLRRQRRVLHP